MAEIGPQLYLSEFSLKYMYEDIDPIDGRDFFPRSIEREYLIKERLAAIMSVLLAISLIGVNTALSHQQATFNPIKQVSIEI